MDVNDNIVMKEEEVFDGSCDFCLEEFSVLPSTKKQHGTHPRLLPGWQLYYKTEKNKAYSGVLPCNRGHFDTSFGIHTASLVHP